MKMEIVVNRLLDLSQLAYDRDEIPVAAVVVKNGEIIGEGINNRNENSTVVGHAEINAIEMACRYLADWRLDGCELYVTLLPCMMCTGAILESRIKKVYYMCNRTNVHFNPTEYICIEKIENEKCNEYIHLLQLFFENKRN